MITVTRMGEGLSKKSVILYGKSFLLLNYSTSALSFESSVWLYSSTYTLMVSRICSLIILFGFTL